MEIAHVGFEEPPCRMFLPGKADERRIEIQAIHDEAIGSQDPRVLASAAGNVKDGPALRIEPMQQTAYLEGFAHVVLEGRVDEVVELRRGAEHLATSAARPGRARFPSHMRENASGLPMLPRRGNGDV